MSTTTQIIDDALALPEEDRTYRAAELLESLDGGQPDKVSPAWRDELSSRVREIDEGRAKMIPSSEVWAEANKRFSISF